MDERAAEDLDRVIEVLATEVTALASVASPPPPRQADLGAAKTQFEAERGACRRRLGLDASARLATLSEANCGVVELGWFAGRKARA
jgi:hypothetical protein